MFNQRLSRSRGFSRAHLLGLLCLYFLVAFLLFSWLQKPGLLLAAGLGLAALKLRPLFFARRSATRETYSRQQRFLIWAVLVLLVMAAGGLGLFDTLFRPAPTPVEVQSEIHAEQENDARLSLANMSQSEKADELKSALEAHEKLVQLGNPRLDGLNYKARALIGLKQLEEGQKLYREWLSVHPGREGLSEFAHALYRNGYHREALGVFKEALTLGQNCEDLGGAGLCALTLGDKVSATYYSKRSSACEGFLSKQLRWAMQARPDYSLFGFGPTGGPFSGKTPYQITLSNDGGAGQAQRVTITASLGEKVVATKTVPAVGANSREKVTLKLPSSLVGAVVLTVDPKDEIWEIDETDNNLTELVSSD